MLTLSTAFIASSKSFLDVMVFFIMFLSAIKFLLIAFHFMELKKAHLFWKASLILTLGAILLIVWMIK